MRQAYGEEIYHGFNTCLHQKKKKKKLHNLKKTPEESYILCCMF